MWRITWKESLEKELSWKLLGADSQSVKILAVLEAAMTGIDATHVRHFEETEIAILLTIGLIKNTLGEKWILLIWKIRNSHR